MYDVLVIGAGVSGLSAAVELVSRGLKVLVCEKAPHAGGRTSSFFDKPTSEWVDNGQHLMMGCYTAARRYLQIIGSEHLAELQPVLNIPYYRAGSERTELRCLPLPSLLHAGSGLIRFSAIPFRERLLIISVVKEILFRSNPKELDGISAAQWLSRLNQSHSARKDLWDMLCIGTLNNAPEKVSALIFFRVLKAIFTGVRTNSCFLLPRAPLSRLLIDPALEYIRSHGGEIRTGTVVQKLRIENDRVVSAQLNDGKKIAAKSIIAAVPWYAVNALTEPEIILDKSAFCSAPIISIQLWLDRKILNDKFAALIDTSVQWVFDAGVLLKNQEKTGQHLSFVISGAESFSKITKTELIDLAWNDLCSVLPASSQAKIVHALVIKEKRATFIPAPGLESKRPAAQTRFKNLFLAGDWTDTGFPATIEGAIRSGVKAALRIVNGK
ncbi:MAG: hydroxysqualene dehydroxylase HpnE [Bacteroidota bacterium]